MLAVEFFQVFQSSVELRELIWAAQLVNFIFS